MRAQRFRKRCFGLGPPCSVGGWRKAGGEEPAIWWLAGRDRQRRLAENGRAHAHGPRRSTSGRAEIGRGPLKAAEEEARRLADLREAQRPEGPFGKQAWLKAGRKARVRLQDVGLVDCARRQAQGLPGLAHIRGPGLCDLQNEEGASGEGPFDAQEGLVAQ